MSRVLNGKPGVSEATREAVLTALDVLGYERPTKLRGERARLVGLVLPELQNPIFPAFAEVVGGALAQRGFTPVLCTRTAGGVSEADYVEMLLGQQVSGIVFAGGHYAQADADARALRAAAGRSLPVVLVNAAIEELGFPRVSCDDEVAVEQAIGHLASLGHTTDRAGPRPGRPRAVRAQAAPRRRRSRSAAAWSSAERQVVAQRHTRSRAGRPRRPGCCGRASPASCAPATRWRSARSGPPGGPGCACRTTSRWSATTTRPFMSCTEPPLTTVRQPIEPMGRAAVDLLVSQIDGAVVPPGRAAVRARAGGARLDRPGADAAGGARRLIRGRVPGPVPPSSAVRGLSSPLGVSSRFGGATVTLR